MPKSWDKNPPANKTMSIEEMQKRVADGIKKRQQRGEMLSPDLPILRTTPNGPALTKEHKVKLIAAANLAIYSLANAERVDYCGAADVIRAVGIQGGFGREFFAAMMQGIAEQAADLCGEPVRVLDQLARHWLAEYFTPSEKLISIPREKMNGNPKI